MNEAKSNSVDISSIQLPKPLHDVSALGLEFAPVMRPTENEFANPMEYIKKIKPFCEKYGICKIIPPSSWKPPFSLDQETRKQQINEMEGKTRASLNYMDGLTRYHEQNGNSLQKAPTIVGKFLDLYVLKREVEVNGGFLRVSGENLWSKIATNMGFKSVQEHTSQLYHYYVKYIAPYETFVSRKAGAKPKSTARGGMTGATTEIRRGVKRPVSDLECGEVEQKSSSSWFFKENECKSKLCEYCKDEIMSYDVNCACSECHKTFHSICVAPHLTKSPKEWLCPGCICTKDDFSFEESAKLYTMKEFKDKADDFKTSFFKAKFDAYDKPNEIPEHVVEREFWRLAGSFFENVEVEYGADLHTSESGSGFPAINKSRDQYVTHPWNFNNLPLLEGSLLRFVQHDIDGMIVPWVYVGMCFSTFCWHTEDHHTYSINYVHCGDAKTWYGVPSEDALKLEQVMRKEFPELFQSQPDLLYHITTMLSPKKLRDAGVRVYTAHQRWGEFVVTFPQSYHAGFNQGFNVAEAVNFALPDWIPFGADCVERYKQFSKLPVFSHEELIFRSKIETKTNYRELDSEFRRVCAKELMLRKKLEKRQIRTILMHSKPEDNNLCRFCKAMCYLSYVTCKCSKKMMCASLEDKQCKCADKQLVLHVRATNDELRNFLRGDVTSLSNVVSRFDALSVDHDNERTRMSSSSFLFMAVN